MAGRITKAIRRERTAEEIAEAERAMGEATKWAAALLERWSAQMQGNAALLHDLVAADMGKAMGEAVARIVEDNGR